MLFIIFKCKKETVGIITPGRSGAYEVRMIFNQIQNQTKKKKIYRKKLNFVKCKFANTECSVKKIPCSQIKPLVSFENQDNRFVVFKILILI